MKRAGWALLGALSCIAPRAFANESSYCRAAHARAAADSSLLMWPKVVVQGLKLPSGGNLDPLLGGGTGAYQFRGGLTFSAMDLLKGLRMQRTAEAQCAQHEARLRIEDALQQDDDFGRVSALRKQAAYLKSQQSRWLALRDRAEERFAGRLITLIELNDLRRRVTDLERKLAIAQGEVERISARGFPERVAGKLGELAHEYRRRAVRFEQAQAGVRALSAWDLKLAGGVAVGEQIVRDTEFIYSQANTDWYGLVELSFNTGAFAARHYERRYQEARAAETAQAPYEPAVRAERFSAQQRAAAMRARQELAIADKQAASISATLRTLDLSEARDTTQAIASLSLDEIWIESERSYLRELVSELSINLEGNHE